MFIDDFVTGQTYIKSKLSCVVTERKCFVLSGMKGTVPEVNNGEQ